MKWTASNLGDVAQGDSSGGRGMGYTTISSIVTSFLQKNYEQAVQHSGMEHSTITKPNVSSQSAVSWIKPSTSSRFSHTLSGIDPLSIFPCSSSTPIVVDTDYDTGC
eukprot:12103226-Ditylum_brightwellii.AAC.1